jgi:hypothetical protein
MDEQDIRIENYIDKISQFIIRKEFYLSNEVKSLEDGEALKVMFLIGRKMVDYGYVQMNNSFDGYVTPILQQARIAGGHLAYQKILKDKANRQKEIEDANYDLTVSALQINKYAYKTRIISIVGAVISVGVAIVALIYSIMTYYNS